MSIKELVNDLIEYGQRNHCSDIIEKYNMDCSSMYCSECEEKMGEIFTKKFDQLPNVSNLKAKDLADQLRSCNKCFVSSRIVEVLHLDTANMTNQYEEIWSALCDAIEHLDINEPSEDLEELLSFNKEYHTSADYVTLLYQKLFNKSRDNSPNKLPADDLKDCIREIVRRTKAPVIDGMPYPLDRDGVPCHVNDLVYRPESVIARYVLGCRDDYPYICLMDDDGNYFWDRADKYTHSDPEIKQRTFEEIVNEFTSPGVMSHTHARELFKEIYDLGLSDGRAEKGEDSE